MGSFQQDCQTVATMSHRPFTSSDWNADLFADKKMIIIM